MSGALSPVTSCIGWSPCKGGWSIRSLMRSVMQRLVLMALCLAAVAVCLQPTPSWAKEAEPLAQDPVMEARLTSLAEQLRCLVCQNESLAGSRSDLALDLRREIRTLMRQGQTDEQILAFMVGRYGDFVLYNPPVKSTTWLLWAGPFVLMLIGVGVLLLVLKRRRLLPEPPQTAEQQARLQVLLKNSTPPTSTPPPST
jgi:cytochrome c-type biogenesis protein CcmH